MRTICLSDNLNELSDSLFEGCTKLENIIIPEGVTNIGSFVFSNCMSLYSVTSLINMPFNLDESVFQYTGTQYDKNIVYMAATLYVPRGRTAMYSNVEGW